MEDCRPRSCAEPARGRPVPHLRSLALRAAALWCALVLGLPLVSCGRASSPPLFELRSPSETGIRFANTLTEDDSVYNALDFDYLYNGAGVGVGDVNNDGQQDVFLAGNMVSSRLYLNRGGLRFDDVTEAAGVQTSVWTTGVSMVDINHDGLLDIYVSVAGPAAHARANLLFVNQGIDDDGTPRFAERAKAFGIADTGYSTHAAFLDYDGDGDLDVYVLTNALEKFNRNTIRPRIMSGGAPSTDRLYRNNGNGTFTDVSREAGIVIEGYGLGVAVSDLNADGWPDIYAANDFMSNDLVWINNRDGTFTNRAAKYLKHQTYNGMGADIADYNNDGLVDIIVLDMLPPDNPRRKMMLQGGNYDRFRMSLMSGYEPQYMRNTLQLNNGPGADGAPTFSEIGQLAGVHETDWSWAPLFADLDNDGLKDLFISNGYRRDVTNLDYVVYLQEGSQTGPESKRRANLLEGLRTLPEVKLANYAFKNRGDLTFADASREWGVDVASYSNGAVYADLDNDGDLDLVVNNIDDHAFVFENHADRLSDRNYLRVALAGPALNRSGIGATVTTFTGGVRQYLEQSPFRGYKSTVEPILHFGVGSAKSIDSLQVRWPDSVCQLLTGVASNRVVTARHADARPCAPAKLPEDVRLGRPVSERSGLDVAHEEREVVDFKVTPLSPHKHSMAGPGIALGDVDGNGLDDVYVGTDRGREKAIHLQIAPGRFKKRMLPGDREHEDMGALFFDAEGDGDNDLYVASGGFFITSDSGVYRHRLYVNDGRGNLSITPDALPDVASSASSVVAADYDRDGDLDLFVGGRVIAGKYPLPARSHLLRNDSHRGGPARFTDVTETSAPGLANAGLVSSALWTDFDQDDQMDLLLVGEWMPLTFFRNRGGTFENVTGATGLGATHGWWNSIVSGDFDNDGDVDYVAGNLGLNTAYRASQQEPVRVHAADFDGNGSTDPVISRYIQGASYPVASRDLMIDQMIGMKGRFPRYSDFATATLERTLTREELAKAYLAQAVTFASAYVENLGSGKFALRPLPLLAQAAPIFGMLVDDYDADGNLDALLVGNSYARETQSGWDDAFIGAVLLGDGKGEFRVMNGASSGFFVDGDAKAIAQLVVDETRSLVLVTQNNDSLLRFTALRSGSTRNVKLEPLDTYAVLTLISGKSRRQNLHYGSTYLSQSSRALRVGDDVVRGVVYDSRGRSRALRVAGSVNGRR
jgi:enediyne biosynthesis protein E4